jgi:DUF2934 family protein
MTMNGNHSPDAVRDLAYQLWLERGCEGGSPEQDWLRAEQILSEQHRAALQESAPPQGQEQLQGQAQGAEPRKATEKVDRAVDESFPASDPPAVHLKDDPPVNAGDKWKAAEKVGKAGRNNKRSDGSARV